MRRKLVSLMTLIILLTGVLGIAPGVQKVKASGTIHIRADGSVEGTDKIQRVGDIYTFTDNIYDEIVAKRDNIVVDGAGYTLQGTGAVESKGIDLTGRNNVTIKNTEIKAFDWGIWLKGSSNNTISRNNITNNDYGIQLKESSNNSVYGNNVANNWIGIRLSYSSNNGISGNNVANNRIGISPIYSSNNIISGNNITNNDNRGIELFRSSNNIISGNNITNNHLGTQLYGSSNNHFYHNNFTNNFLQVIIETPGSPNFWDDDYPSGGNYWSDYTGADADGDGIGDTPYVIDENNRDRYPLWGLPPPPFWMQWWFWTIIAAGIIVLTVAAYFLKKRARVGIVILSWSVLMILLFFYPFFVERFGQKVSFFLWSGYTLVTSLSLTKFFEKRGIIERFGLQRNNALGLLVVAYLGLLVVYYFDLKDLRGIIFAPLFEEIFYRGYMLGTLCKCDHNKWEWRLIDLGWIIFTSLLFALGHIFKYYPISPILGIIFVGSLTLGFLYVRLRTILWCFLVHMLYNLSLSFGITYVYFYILAIFSTIILLTYLLKYLSKLIRNLLWI